MTAIRSRLLIAEHEAVRRGVEMVLGDKVVICAQAGDATQAIRAAMREQPDICLVGRDLPGGGLQAVRGICRAAPNSAVVVLAQARDIDDMLCCLRRGAIGYVPDPLDGPRLRRIVQAVHANEAVLPRAMVLDLVLEVRGDGGGGLLTSREAQVLRLLRGGHATAAIAQRLEIAPVTVRRHISELVRKFGVEHRSMLTDAGGRWWAPPTSAPAINVSGES